MDLTGTLLAAVARGAPDTIRVFRPGPTVAFGRSDCIRTGFEEACRVAVAHGRTPVVRLGGGHAAAYDSDCLVVELLRRHDRRAISGLEDRFRDMVNLVRRALARLGVDLVLGELPREYCPGRYSLHLPAGPKVAGVAQRVLTRASLTTAVIVVGGTDALRGTLADVYATLDLPLDIETVGAVADRHPEVDCDLAQRTIIDEAAAEYEMVSPRRSESASSRTFDGCYTATGMRVTGHA